MIDTRALASDKNRTNSPTQVTATEDDSSDTDDYDSEAAAE